METEGYNIKISPEIHEIIKETRKGTNLSNADVIELIIRQYFKSKQLPVSAGGN